MKGKKIIVPLLLAGVTATGVVANVQQQQVVEVSAVDKTNWSVLGDDIKVEGGFDIREDGKVYLPVVTTTTGTDESYEYKVTKGDKVIEVLEDAGSYYFVAKYEGYYNVAISTTTTTGVKTEVKNLSVWIEGQDAVINLPTNSKYVIPAKVPASLANCAQDKLYIPVPTVTIGDDEKETTIDKLTTGQQLSARLITPKNTQGIKLVADNTNSFYTVAKTDLESTGTYTIVYEYRTGADAGDDGYLDKVVSRLESNFQVVSSYDLSKVKLTVSMLDSMPTSGCVNREVSVPKLKVTESASSLDAINTYVKVTIKNLTTGATLDDSAFNYDTYTFTPKTEGEYMVSYKASIDLFGKSTTDVTPDQTIKVSDTESAVVMPTVNYTVENGVITKVNGVTIEEEKEGEKVVKTKAEVAEEKLKENTLENFIPSAVRLKDNGSGKKEAVVTIPALFATDNLDTFNDMYTGKTKQDKPLLERSYRAPNGAVISIGTAENVNEAQTVTLTTAGTYEFRFKATDKAGNPAGYKEYEVVVYDSEKDMEADKTKLELSVGIKTISNKDQVLKFSKPTVEDAYDKSISTKTFYKAVTKESDAPGAALITSDAIEITETNDDGKYVLDVEELLEKHARLQQIKIYSEAYVDGSLLNTREAFDETKTTVEKTADGSIIVRTKEEANVVNVVNSDDDTKAPDIDAIDWNLELIKINDTQYDEDEPTKVVRESILVDGAKDIDVNGYALNAVDGTIITKEINSETVNQAAFDQGNDVIYLPAVTFTDEFDGNMEIMLTIKNDFGDVVSKVSTESIDVEHDGSKYVYTISGASFKLSNYGVYTVTYQATDIGGNIRVKTFGIRVNDKTAPTIVIDDLNAFDKDIEVGKKFEVPQGKLVKNGTTMTNTPTWEIYKVSKGAEYKIVGDTGFVPLTAGTFTIRYTGVDEAGNYATLENSLFTVSAKDTTKPELSLLEDYYLNTVIDEFKPDEEEGDSMTVYIPVANAYDGMFKENGKVVDYGYGRDLEVTYSVSGPSSTSPEITDVSGRDDVKAFKATKQGTYTVTYSATDGINTTKITKTIYIGDCEKPEITWDNQEQDLQSEVSLGSEFKLDLSKIKFTDNKTSFDAETLKKNLTITMTDPDGNSVKNKGTAGVNFICDMDKVGSYTLKFVLKDEVGNNQTASYSINVPEEEVEEETISPVLGTVLVVLSVVVLAGVVIYFVASSRKKGGKAPKKASKK